MSANLRYCSRKKGDNEVIDEKKLIEKIEFSIKASNTQHDNYMSGLRNGMRYCLALITGKEPGFEECKQWIPVSERLPESEGIYLITTKIIDKKEVVYAFYSKDLRGFVCNGNAIAWQPLPEPYQGGREE